MTDGMILILIALAVAAVPFFLQTVLCLKCKSIIGKVWPLMLFLPVWVPCALDAVDVIGLPRTYFLGGGFFHDEGLLFGLGFPVLAGHLLGWAAATLMKRIKK